MTKQDEIHEPWWASAGQCWPGRYPLRGSPSSAPNQTRRQIAPPHTLFGGKFLGVAFLMRYSFEGARNPTLHGAPLSKAESFLGLKPPPPEIL